MPHFLCEEINEYIKMFYSAGKNDRIFPFTKHYLTKEMERGSKQTGVKCIRIHDLRQTYMCR